MLREQQDKGERLSKESRNVAKVSAEFSFTTRCERRWWSPKRMSQMSCE